MKYKKYLETTIEAPRSNRTQRCGECDNENTVTVESNAMDDITVVAACIYCEEAIAFEFEA